MLLKRFKISTIIFLVVCCVIQFEAAASYKTEVEITPAPPEEETTKKTGFFGGVKNWFRGSPSTTPLPVLEATTQKTPNTLAGPNNAVAGQTSSGAQRPPPLVIGPPAPLVPLGPRVDTPSTSPWDAGNPQQPPQWPQTHPQGQQVGGGGAFGSPQQPHSPQVGGGGAFGSPQQPHSPQVGGGGGSGYPHQPPQGGGSPKPGGAYMPGGAHIPGGMPMPVGSSTTPKSPQTPQHVQNNLPQPGSGQPNVSPSQPTNNVQHNLPRPGAGLAPATQTSTSYSNQNNLPRPGGGGQPNLPPGFAPYQPPKTQPSGFDLSYGGGSRPSQPAGGRPGFGPAPSASSTPMAATSTTTTTTTAKPQQMDFDLRLGGDTKRPATPTNTKDDFPALPGPRRPSTGGSVKEEYPALPTPKSPSPSSPVSPSSPSAWNKPLPTPASIAPTATTTTLKPPSHNMPAAPTGGGGGNGVSFVPHRGPTTTVRPGFQSTSDSNAVATDVEIQTLTENLFTKEVNSQLSLITVNAQGKTRSIDSTDEAPQPLLDVNAKAFENPTVAKMRLLFNNYEPDTLTNEHVTPNERKEENDFVDAVMATNVMRQAMLFLQNKGIVGPDPRTHRELVKELWFTQYSRGSGKIGSSGFEHVFVNEVKNGTIIGLHNWVYFSDEEKAGRLDYKGYLNQLDLGSKAKVLKVRFTHNGLNKPVNTLFIGTSPELELALYTVCFKLRPDRSCPVSLGNSKFGVVTYSWRYRGKSLIGSAYPEI